MSSEILFIKSGTILEKLEVPLNPRYGFLDVPRLCDIWLLVWFVNEDLQFVKNKKLS